MSTEGTPLTLDQLIEQMLNLKPMHDRALKDHIYHMMKDFLAQKFQTAMLIKPELDSTLTLLFNNITKR